MTVTTLFDMKPAAVVVFSKDDGARITRSHVALKGVYFGVVRHETLVRPMVKIGYSTWNVAKRAQQIGADLVAIHVAGSDSEAKRLEHDYLSSFHPWLVPGTTELFDIHDQLLAWYQVNASKIPMVDRDVADFLLTLAERATG